MNLYSRSRFLASALLVLVCAAAVTTAFAQRRKAHKLRATAVVEVTTDSAGIVATHIFPVTILDEGSFHDASIYKATPEPMALDKGIVYEAQKDGIPVGYATILSSANNNGWTALGKWQMAEEPKKAQAQLLPRLLLGTTGQLSIAAMPALRRLRPTLLRRAIQVRQPAPLPQVLPQMSLQLRQKMPTGPCCGGALRPSRNQLPRLNLLQLRLLKPLQRDCPFRAPSCL